MKVHQEPTKALENKELGQSENIAQTKSMSPPSFNLSSQPVQQKSEAESGGAESGLEMAGGGGGKQVAGANGGPADITSKMSNAFGQDFSDVKIHENSSASTEMGALAFAQGNEVHFAPGQFNPESQAGQELIGHEFAHVVQQREGRVQANTDVGGTPVNNDKSLESEADQLGAQAARGATQLKANASTSAGPQAKMAVQRKVLSTEKDKEDFFKTYRERAEGVLAGWYTTTKTKDDRDQLTGAMFENAARKIYTAKGDTKYIVPVEFALAQARLEGGVSRRERGGNGNVFNYGAFDSGVTSIEQGVNSLEKGFDAYYTFMANKMLDEETPEQLLEKGNFTTGVGQTGGVYATNPVYEGHIKGEIGKMNMKTAGFALTASVGIGASNKAADVLKVGTLLVKLGYLKDNEKTDAAKVGAAILKYQTTEIAPEGEQWFKNRMAAVTNAKDRENMQIQLDSLKDGVVSNKGTTLGVMYYYAVMGGKIQTEGGVAPTTGTPTTTTAPTTTTTTATPTTTTATTATPTTTGRVDEKMDRVETTSKKDNSFTSSRWVHTDGTKTEYAKAFDTQLAIQLKTEFGKEITQAEVYKMITDAEAKGDHKAAEDARKKLFIANQYAVVEALNVSKKTADGTTSGQNAMGRDFRSADNHEMYGKTKTDAGNQTYCNIYAYDVVSAMGGYIPRLWWLDAYEKKAIEAMNQNKPYEEKVEYGKTVGEVNANALNAWFDRIGSYFGWEKASSMEAAQNSANEGNIVVLSAANKSASSSGHVSVILAERGTHTATRVDGKTSVPLTSQAGSTNYKYGTNGDSKWWENSSHKNGHAWVYKGKPDSPLMKPEHIGMSDNVAATANGATTTATTTPATTTTTTPTTGSTTTTPTTTTTTTPKPATETLGKAIGSGEVTASSLNVRSGPAATFDKVGSPLKNGEKVTYYAEKDGWLQIGVGKWVSATYVKKSTTAAAKPTVAAKPSMDFNALATTVHNAMAGLGTDEAAVYNALATLKHDDQLISQFMAAYQAKYKVSVVDDIKGDFSNNIFFGNQLDTALGYLNLGPQKPAAPVTTTKPATADKPASAEKPATAAKPVVPAGQTTVKAPVGDTPIAGREAVTITGTVGKGCANAKEDVKKIQSLLADAGLQTRVSGTCDKATLGAIYLFQTGNHLTADGQIGPKGDTLKKLNATPKGAFSNSKAAMDKDPNAPKFTHPKFTNPDKLYRSSDGMYVPEQQYATMKNLITQVNALGDNVTKMLNVNSGFRSPNYNATLEGSATASNHQFGQAIDISSPNYTSKQLYDKVLELIKAGKMQDGGLGIYKTFIHYDVGGAGRRWDNR